MGRSTSMFRALQMAGSWRIRSICCILFAGIEVSYSTIITTYRSVVNTADEENADITAAKWISCEMSPETNNVLRRIAPNVQKSETTPRKKCGLRYACLFRNRKGTLTNKRESTKLSLQGRLKVVCPAHLVFSHHSAEQIRCCGTLRQTVEPVW